MRNKKNIRPGKDFLGGVIFLICSVLIFTVIIPLAVPVSFVPPGQISPRFLPKVLSGAMAFISVLVLLSCFLNKNSSKEDEDQTDPATTETETKAQEGTSSTFLKMAPILSMAVIIVSYLLLIWCGFIVSSIFSLAAIMFAFGERKASTLIIVSVVVTALVWVFAVKLLNIPIP